MIKEEYDHFVDAYQVLLDRSFEIEDIRQNSLVARVTKSKKFLPEHDEIEAILSKKSDKWILEVDDSFYLDRTIYNGRESLHKIRIQDININKGKKCGSGELAIGLPLTEEDKKRVRRSIESSMREEGRDVVINLPDEYWK